MSEELVKYEFKIINRSLMITREIGPLGGITSWRVKPNIFEAVKAECVWSAKDSSKQYLPRFSIEYGEFMYPDLHKWRDAFTSDNPPENVSFRGCDISKELENIDFSKPYDDKVAQEIRGRYVRKSHIKKTEVDADLIIQGELGELE